MCLFSLSVPIDRTQGIQMLYVFVDIKIDTGHFIDTLRYNFKPGARLALVSTIQFVAALQVKQISVQLQWYPQVLTLLPQ